MVLYAKHQSGWMADFGIVQYHGDQVLKKYGPKLKIGTVEGAKL